MWVTWLCSCTAGYEADPLVEFSTDIVVTGSRPHTLTRQLDAGVYLLEVRERDIDLRVGVDTGASHTELADVCPRHGLFRMVVRLEAPSRLRLTLDSSDVRGWKGAAAVRFLRWPRTAADASASQRLLGFEALGTANELVARGTPEAWRAALEPLRDAARRFQAGRDMQSLAEAEYQRGYLELALLFNFDDGRRSAESALAHFRAAGDSTGARRAAVLLAEQEFALAAAMGPAVPRGEQRALLDTASARLRDAQAFFEATRHAQRRAACHRPLAGTRAPARARRIEYRRLRIHAPARAGAR